MTMQSISLEPLSKNVGARITGLDCGALNDATAATLREAWRTYRVLIFRDSVRGDDDLVALGKAFGELLPSRFASPLASRSEIMVITNVTVNGQVAGGLPDGEMEWHYDGMHQQNPYRGAILYCEATPSRGGETSFADMRRAYRDLPEAFKKRLDGLKAASSYDYNAQAGAGKKVDNDAPKAVHPVVRPLSDTGENAIFVAKLMTDRILDVDESESDEILTSLYAQMSRPEYAYEHQWQVGDAVLWDNHCIVHARNDFDPGEQRLLKRVTIR
jgi:taurine dioxygenase